MEEAPSTPSPETAGLTGAAGGAGEKPLDPDGSLTVEQVSDPPPLVVPGDADGSLTVEQVSDPPPRVAKLEPLDPHGSMTVDQVSEDPPDACPDEPPVLSVTSRVPVSIDASTPRPRRPRANPSVRLDPTEAALDLPPAPPRAKPSRGLPPYAVALFGGLFGLAAIASVLAVLIQVDGPNRGLPEAADSASGSASSRAGTPNRERAPSPLVAPGSASETPSPAAAATASAEPEPPPGPWRVAALASDDGVKMVTGKLGTRSLMDALEEEHVQKPQIFRILKSFEDPKVFDKPRKSHTYAVAIDRASKRVRAFEYQSSPTDIWQAKETEEGRLVGQKLDMKVEQHRVAKAIVVKEDLKAAVVEAGFDDDLLDTLDDALEDRISLSRLGRGCTLRVIAQEQTVFGRFARYVDIEAVEFWTPRSEKPTRVYHYRAGKTSGYFDENGKAPYKGGWRAPLKFPRVTSRFNPKRLHPVLHTVMPHNGTDFGAPSGTPVYAASHGTVSHVGPHGPSGNLVLVEHAGGIETGYAHLSKFAPGIKKGDKVETRQLVGFVGSTGRSTGPHLHFSVKKNGQFVDPLTALKMDGERVLPPSERDAFGVFKAELDKVLDALPLPERGGTAVPPADDDDDKDSHGEESESPPPGHAPAPAAPNAPAPPPATAPEPAKKGDEDDSPVWKPQALLQLRFPPQEGQLQREDQHDLAAVRRGAGRDAQRCVAVAHRRVRREVRREARAAFARPDARADLDADRSTDLVAARPSRRRVAAEVAQHLPERALSPRAVAALVDEDRQLRADGPRGALGGPELWPPRAGPRTHSRRAARAASAGTELAHAPSPTCPRPRVRRAPTRGRAAP